MAGTGFDLSRHVEHITSPTLVLHGAEDRYVPVANAAALAGAIPGARLRVLEKAGHLVFIERFAEVSREVDAFLKPRNRASPPRGTENRPAGVWRWIPMPLRALRRRWGQTRSSISRSISARGHTPR